MMSPMRKIHIDDVEDIGVMLDIRECFTGKEKTMLGDNIVLSLLREKI